MSCGYTITSSVLNSVLQLLSQFLNRDLANLLSWRYHKALQMRKPRFSERKVIPSRWPGPLVEYGTQALGPVGRSFREVFPMIAALGWRA